MYYQNNSKNIVHFRLSNDAHDLSVLWKPIRPHLNTLAIVELIERHVTGSPNVLVVVSPPHLRTRPHDQMTEGVMTLDAQVRASVPITPSTQAINTYIERHRRDLRLRHRLHRFHERCRL